MYSSLKLLKKKILEYEHCEISRDMLTEWAYDTLMNNLQNQAIADVDSLVIYPFLSALAVKSDSLEFCSESEISSFLDIIEGKMSMNHAFFIKIPKTTVSDDILKIEKTIKSYEFKGSFSERDKNIIEEIYLVTENRANQTISDFLIKNLLKLISYLPTNHYSRIETDSINIDDNDLSFDFLMKKILSTINILQGELCIYVSIFFEKGVVNILLS